jgi:hypothetical protein
MIRSGESDFKCSQNKPLESHAAPKAANPPTLKVQPVASELPKRWATQKMQLHIKAVKICGAEIAMLCKLKITPASQFVTAPNRSSGLLLRRSWRVAISTPIIANGAQSVNAQDNPRQPMTMMPPVFEVTKMVDNVAMANSMCEAVQTCITVGFQSRK